MDRATFCLWRRHGDTQWNVVLPSSPAVEPDDGSAELLRLLDADPNSYQAWAESYYEQSVPVAAVRAIYEHSPLTPDLLSRLNPELTLAAVREDAAEIDYPIAPGACPS
jgi:hypothetical protein